MVEKGEVLPSEVVTALGLDAARVTRLLGGQVNDVWMALLGGAEVAVRRSPPYRRLSEVVYEAEVLRRLRDVGAPVASPVAEPVVVDDRVWAMFEWVDGVPLPRPSRDPYRYGRLLGEVHEASSRIAPDFGQRPTACRSDEFFHHDRGGTSLAAVVEDFARRGGPVAAHLAELAIDVHELLDAAGCSERAQLIAHGDFGPHQVLADRSGAVLAVVDWDFCRIDLTATDLAIATAPVRPTAARAQAMLAGYEEVRRLDAEDLALLGELRRAFHLNNLANQAVLWSRGVDIGRRLDVIAERLERERWWAPMLRAAVHDLPSGRRRRPVVTLRTPDEFDDLAVAHEAADRARVVAQQFFREGVVARSKPDHSPVTEADEAVELVLRHTMAELRPLDAVVGEELGGVVGPRTWIIDPIDGTSYFARGDPNWRIQIALMDGGDISAAVVDAPALGVRWSAFKGKGTRETNYNNDGPQSVASHVSDTSALADARVCVHPAEVATRLGATSVKLVPRTPLPLIDLVRGEIDAFYVDCCQLWDHAPWILLIEEAGGQFTDHGGGHRADRRGGLYSNRAIHQTLLKAIDPSGPANR